MVISFSVLEVRCALRGAGTMTDRRWTILKKIMTYGISHGLNQMNRTETATVNTALKPATAQYPIRFH